MKAVFVLSILVLFSSELFAQMKPTCLRLEGIQLPCIEGNVSEDPKPSCSGTTVPDKAACDEVVCEVRNIILGDYSKSEAQGCKQYNYQCSGSYAGDGCTISCNLSGNSCIAQKSGNCGGIGFSCGQPQRGSCKTYDYTCKSYNNSSCWDGTTVEETGHGVFNSETGCCKCKQSLSIPRCGQSC